MKTIRPGRLVAAGLLLVAAGFIYDVAFAGIPYQDPTPEMAARYARHALVASAIQWCGVAVLATGLLGMAVRFASRRLRGPAGGPDGP